MKQKRQLRRLANKYYTRNARLRDIANRVGDSEKEALLVRNLHSFFDAIEVRTDKTWASKLYWQAMHHALTQLHPTEAALCNL
jgi:hypothetical protein